MYFNHKAIQVLSTKFAPNEELGYFSTFGSYSCYETCFKQNTVLIDRLIQGIQKASEHKLGHQAERDQIKKNILSVNSFFKYHLKDVIDDLRTENDAKPQGN